MESGEATRWTSVAGSRGWSFMSAAEVRVTPHGERHQAAAARIYRHDAPAGEPEIAHGDEQLIEAVSEHVERHIGPIEHGLPRAGLAHRAPRRALRRPDRRAPVVHARHLRDEREADARAGAGARAAPSSPVACRPTGRWSRRSGATSATTGRSASSSSWAACRTSTTRGSARAHDPERRPAGARSRPGPPCAARSSRRTARSRPRASAVLERPAGRVHFYGVVAAPRR